MRATPPQQQQQTQQQQQAAGQAGAMTGVIADLAAKVQRLEQEKVQLQRDNDLLRHKVDSLGAPSAVAARNNAGTQQPTSSTCIIL